MMNNDALSPRARKILEERNRKGIFPADPRKRWLRRTVINRERPFEPEEPNQEDSAMTSTLPSQSQRLRAVLFRVWQESAERKAGMDQEVFYRERMERIIKKERRTLDPPPVV